MIAAYNEEKVIKRTLDYVFQSTYKNFEVIVVNDGSKDKTEKIVKEYIKKNPDKKITYIYQKNQGKAHALNNALNNYANGSLMMCLDADSILRKDTLEKAVKYFRNKNTKAVATNVKILTESSILGITQKLEYLFGCHLKKALTVGNVEYIIGGAGSMFRTAMVRNLGGYDTDTMTEDIDLTMKIVSHGNIKNRLVFAQDAVVFTEGVLSLYALFRQRYRWKIGRFQTFWKHRKLFFNRNKKYSKFLTFIFLPYQLFSEFAFLFDPIFIFYILLLTLSFGDATSYLGMILFVMFYVFFAIVSDLETPAKERALLLLVSPFAYFLFFIVSIVEYAGLIKCIINWKQIIYAKDYKKCGWVPVARLGNSNVKVN